MALVDILSHQLGYRDTMRFGILACLADPNFITVCGIWIQC